MSRVSEIERVDLHRAPEEPLQSVCGEHGLVTPTWQGLCPKCGGYVESGESIVRLREAAAGLRAVGAYDREHVHQIRQRPYYNPQPSLHPSSI